MIERYCTYANCDDTDCPIHGAYLTADDVCCCSHIQDHHYTDRRGRVVCRSAACGCAEFRTGGSK